MTDCMTPGQSVMCACDFLGIFGGFLNPRNPKGIRSEYVGNRRTRPGG